MAELSTLFEIVSIVDAADADAVMARHAGTVRGIAGGKVSAAMMGKLPNLEIIANEGVGVDTTDVPAAKARGIVVTNTPDVLNIAVAELAVAMMLGLARTLPEADRFVRDGKWANGLFPMRGRLHGKTAGIVGLGRIGKEIARRLAAFGMNVVYHGRHEQAGQPYRHYGNLVEMAAASDWLVVIAPAGRETENLVSREVLDALGPQGRLVIDNLVAHFAGRPLPSRVA